MSLLKKEDILIAEIRKEIDDIYKEYYDKMPPFPEARTKKVFKAAYGDKFELLDRVRKLLK